MAVSATPRLIGPYTGTGANAVLPFTFVVYDEADLVVERDGTALAINSDFTVSTNADQDASPGGSITVLAAANTSGSTFYAYAETDVDQSVELPAQGAFSARDVERGLDRQSVFSQENREKLTRALVLPVGETATVLPASASRANKYLGFDADGNVVPLEGSGTATDAALVALEVGNTPRSVAAKLSERISVLDYGAVGDGVTDNTATLQAAIEAVEASGAALEVPPGTYRIDDQVQIRAPIKFVGLGAAKFVVSDGIAYGSADTNGGGGFDVLDVTGVTLTGLEFETEETDDISNIIHFRGCSEISITGCRFASPVAPAGSKCVVIQRSPNVSQVENITITGNQFIDVPTAVLVIGESAEPPNNIVITDNVFDGRAIVGDAAFKVDKYTHNCVISNNTIAGNGYITEGISFEQGSYHVTVSGNSISGIRDYGIKLSDDASDGGGLPYSDVLIDGNFVHNMTDGARHGIRLIAASNGGDNIIIQNNVIKGIAVGIYENTGNFTDLIIDGNKIIDADGAGGSINISSSNAIITRNIIKSTTSAYALNLGGGVTGCKVIGNIFEQDNGNASVNISYGAAHGSDTIMRDNRGPRANSERATGVFTIAPGIEVTEIYGSAGAVTATLPNGSQVGQRKLIHYAASGSINSSTVSVTNHATSDPEVFTFAGRNSSLVLEWMGNEWITIANSGVTV